MHFNKALNHLDFNRTIDYFEHRLGKKTVRLAHGYKVICAFVNDEFSVEILQELQANKTKVIAMRCADVNNIDIKAAQALGVQVSGDRA